MNKDTKLILEIMHVDVLPPSIKDWVIPTPPKKYEGWLYKFTCNISKRIYIGIHKDDGTIYWHSSENEEFQNIRAINISYYRKKNIKFYHQQRQEQIQNILIYGMVFRYMIRLILKK